MEIGAIIGIVGPILLALLQWWQGQQPARDKEEKDEEIQHGRLDIASGNVAAVSERIDRVPEALPPPSDSAGVGDDPDGAGDARTLARMAALGLGSGEVVGKGRVL